MNLGFPPQVEEEYLPYFDTDYLLKKYPDGFVRLEYDPHIEVYKERLTNHNYTRGKMYIATKGAQVPGSKMKSTQNLATLECLNTETFGFNVWDFELTKQDLNIILQTINRLKIREHSDEPLVDYDETVKIQDKDVRVTYIPYIETSLEDVERDLGKGVAE